MNAQGSFDQEALQKAFFQARLKIHRADRHFGEAQALFAHYVEHECCTIVEETDAETLSKTKAQFDAGNDFRND